jgi:hypothetical protein
LRISAVDETNKSSETLDVAPLEAPPEVLTGDVCDTAGATAICPEEEVCFTIDEGAPTCGAPVAECPEAWGAVIANDHPEGDGFSYTGDNTSGESRGAGACGGGGPQEVVFFTAPEAGTWRFQTSSNAMNMVDPLIFAREFCAVASSELDCNDDIDI